MRRLSEVTSFQDVVLDFYASSGRHDLPWRQLAADRNDRFYHVWISEMMLQQTGVPRVIEKYCDWIVAFPSLQSVASAPLGEIIRAWQGLGYNRRALFLHQSARLLWSQGTLPTTIEDLTLLPGVGPNTAAAILTYTDNTRHPFIETNIRTVLLNHFYPKVDIVSDRDLFECLIETLPDDNYREWFWALMDYGTYLKRSGNGQLRRAAAHKPQSRFHGSVRQIRGHVLRLLSLGAMSDAQIIQVIVDSRLDAVLTDLQNEGLITYSRGCYQLP